MADWSPWRCITQDTVHLEGLPLIIYKIWITPMHKASTSRIRSPSATLPGNSQFFFGMFRFMPMMMRTNTQQSTSKYHGHHLFLPPAPESGQTLSRCGVWPGLHRLWSNDKNWHLFLLKWQFFLGDKTWFQKKDRGMQPGSFTTCW